MRRITEEGWPIADAAGAAWMSARRAIAGWRVTAAAVPWPWPTELGGVGTDYLLRCTQRVQIARAAVAVVWVLAVAGLVPAILVQDLVVGVADFTLYLFFTGLAGAPLWAAAPKRLL